MKNENTETNTCRLNRVKKDTCFSTEKISLCIAENSRLNLQSVLRGMIPCNFFNYVICILVTLMLMRDIYDDVLNTKCQKKDVYEKVFPIF